VDVELELGSNEAVKRAVASGLGLGCLSRHAVSDAIASGWLVELGTALPPMRRTLSVVVHRAKQLGSASRAFLEHCLQADR
jgi:DNA-binding transcriptional LysR family regulator